MGKGSAVSVAASLRFSYTGIKLALVVGICGGALLPPTHPDIFLGDVVISNAILQHLYILQQTEIRWHYLQVNNILFKAPYIYKYYRQTPVRYCYADGNIPDNICNNRYQEQTKSPIYIGTVASTNTVIKSTQYYNKIARKKKILAFKIEGAGVWDNIPCIIIKGQVYTAATGALAVKAFLEYWKPDKIYKLEDLISIPNSAKKLAITGLGGVGKTQVALELAYRIPCTSYKAVEQACMAIAQIVEIQDVKPGKVKEHLKTYFSQINTKWLLIFDNADNIEMWTKGSNNTLLLKDFLPFNNQGYIIFTIYNRELAVDLISSDIIHVPELDKKTAVKFLAKSLCQDLQATVYINKKGITVSDYLILLKEQETDVVELLSKDFGDDGCYKDIQNLVAKTWLILLSQVQKLDQLAAEYLSLMALSKLEKTDALGLLSAYSFITIQPGNCFISAHRLLWREYLPHALSLSRDPEFHEQQEQYIDYIYKVGDCLYSDGRYNKAERLLVQVIETRQQEAKKLSVQVIEAQKQVLGPEHHSTLASMNNLALIYRGQGQWKEAEELGIQVMKTWKQYPSTLTSMANLACTWASLGNIQDALALMNKCIELRKKVLGSDHLNTMSSCNALTNWEAAQQTQQDPPTLPYYKVTSK
ncbi:hypothetical protein BDW62DRAFT_213413 [Aspergillus aurantiobrunneus]